MKTRSMRVLAISCGFLLGTFLTAAQPVAAAPPARPSRVQLPAQDLDGLRQEVARARAHDARPFAEVANLVALAPDLNAAARARRAPIALAIARLGPSALLPALELLAVEPARTPPVVRRELIEAAGLFRDPRALPVLSAILDDADEDFETTRSAAEAIARVGGDAAADRLVATLERATGDRARAVISGMGECRRAHVTQTIAERLRTAPDEATVRAAIRALGRAGNAWAWPTLRDRGDEQQVRATSARALVEAFVRHDGDLRIAASNALMLVDAPETPALVASAKKTANAETAGALDALAARFARNPARTPSSRSR